MHEISGLMVESIVSCSCERFQ